MYISRSHQSQNRLADLVAEHLDHLHYINDILCLNIIDLNQVLTEHLLYKLLIPLYIYSLTGSRVHGGEIPADTATNAQRTTTSDMFSDHSDTLNGRVSSVVALFLLSQVFLIITHAPLVRTLAWIILKADRSIFDKDSTQLHESCSHAQVASIQTNTTTMTEQHPDSDTPANIEEQKNATDEEKLLVTTPTSESICMSPFLEAVIKALDCSENDYTALFSLSILYALGNNKGTRTVNTKVRLYV